MRNRRLLIIFSVLCAISLIIVLSSVIFSVQNVYENCENGDSSIIYEGDTTLGQKVLNSHNFEKGESIFFASKESAARSIEKKIPSVKVTLIEKSFPNRIYISYRILYDYLEVKSGTENYVLSENCKITSVSKISSETDKVVKVFLSGSIGSPSAGEFLRSDKEGEIETLSNILDALIRLKLNHNDITLLFEFIDLSSPSGHIFMKTSTGAYLRLMGWNNIALKVQAAFSAYSLEISYRYSGTITVSDNLVPTYADEVLYQKAI